MRGSAQVHVLGNTANNTGTEPGQESDGGGVFIAGGSDNIFDRGLILGNRAAGQGHTEEGSFCSVRQR